jgi:membrane associated rhomboid family serine protease
VIPLRDTLTRRTFPIVTWLLVAANAAVFLRELTIPPEELERLVERFGLVPARAGEIVPFFTSMFLHGGWMHVIGNLWTLWIFGDNVEERMGRLRYLAFYFVTGLVAGVAHVLANPGSEVPSMGASGAIAGILGAYLFLFPRARIVTLVPLFFWPVILQVPAVFYLLVWFATQVFGGTLAGVDAESAGGIAWWAHIGGFGAGAILHRAFLLRRPRYQYRS